MPQRIRISGDNKRRRKKRDRIIERDGIACWICGKDTILAEFSTNRNGPMVASLDHIIPSSKGGTHDDDNLKIACRKCNYKRGNKLNGS